MKGFIGPLGDDIPAIIAILLALSLFFGGVVYAIDAFNQKERNTQVLTASIEMGRAATQKSILPVNLYGTEAGDIRKRMEYVAKSYGINFNPIPPDPDIFYDDGSYSCQPNDFIVKYLVPTGDYDLDEPVELETLVICVRRTQI